MSQPEPHALTTRATPARSWGRRLRPWLTGGVAVAVVAGLVLAMRPSPVPVDVLEVKRGPITVTVDEDGVARVKDRYTLSLPLNGRLDRLELHPGDDVKTGDLVARVAPVGPPLLDARSRTEAETRLAAARTAVRQAEGAVRRAEDAHTYVADLLEKQRQLAAGGVVPGADLDRAVLAERSAAEDLRSAKFGAQIANYEVAAIEAALGRGKVTSDEQHEVRSPIDGRVLKVFVQSEGVAGIGTPIVELGDPNALEIAVDVLTTDAVHITPGAKVTLDGWGGEDLDGHVRLVEPSAFTRLSALGVEEQRVNLIIDLDGDPARRTALGDGWRVEAHVLVWQVDDAVVAPSSALFRDAGKWAVFLVEGGRAARRHVEVGRKSGLDAEILSGLAPGDTVIVYPGDAITDGKAVAPR